MSTKQGDVTTIDATKFRARVREAAERLDKNGFRNWLMHHETHSVNLRLESNETTTCPIAVYLRSTVPGLLCVRVCPDQYRFIRPGDDAWTRIETPAWAREFIQTWDRIAGLTDKTPKAARIILDELISQGF